MISVELAQAFEQWSNDLLVWIGFGTLAGLLANAIMPGRDPGGAGTTLLMGIGGSVIGSGTLMYFSDGQRVTPISPLGFVVATAGAFILLFFYRLLAGRFFHEGAGAHRGEPPRGPYARRRRRDHVYED
ncbi:MAG: GlsB/YeaQ/YmgE family stress response membrane protein [Pirellulales bacterium]